MSLGEWDKAEGVLRRFLQEVTGGTESTAVALYQLSQVANS